MDHVDTKPKQVVISEERNTNTEMNERKFKQTNRFKKTDADSGRHVQTKVDEEKIQADRRRQTDADSRTQIQTEVEEKRFRRCGFDWRLSHGGGRGVDGCCRGCCDGGDEVTVAVRVAVHGVGGSITGGRVMERVMEIGRRGSFLGSSKTLAEKFSDGGDGGGGGGRLAGGWGRREGMRCGFGWPLSRGGGRGVDGCCRGWCDGGDEVTVVVRVAVHGVGGSITGGGVMERVMEVAGDGDDAGWPLWATVMEAAVEWWTMEVGLSGMVDLIDQETGIVFRFARNGRRKSFPAASTVVVVAGGWGGREGMCVCF
uniref:Uncharacterized protein n=1 Tax=Tanacetum cinerariifolium TaxID=118510 RepID=A0A6L2N4N0_TANCI|nr:hypothetical protein [Tanacetum cinerariifolium]